MLDTKPHQKESNTKHYKYLRFKVVKLQLRLESVYISY